MKTIMATNAKKLILTDTKIIYGETEYLSASEALDAYILDHDQSSAYSIYLPSNDVNNLLANPHPVHHSVNVSGRGNARESSLNDVRQAVSGLHGVGTAISDSLVKMKSVDRLLEYADVLKESKRVLQKTDADNASTVISGTDIGTMATETLINVNPYLPPRQSRSHHFYSYRTANTRSRSLSQNRKFGKALVDDYVSDIQPQTTQVSNDLLAKTAEVLTTSRAEIDAINSLDKRINSLDDSLLKHQIRRSHSVPVRTKNISSNIPHKAPNWLKDLDDSLVSGYSTDIPKVNIAGNGDIVSNDRHILAQRWLAEIESESDFQIPTSPTKSEFKSTPSSPLKSAKQKRIIERGNLRVDFVQDDDSDSIDLAKQYADLNTSAIAEQKRVDKMLNELDQIKQSFESTAHNVDKLQTPLKKLSKPFERAQHKKALTSTMNADDSDVNVIDDGEISSISQHATGTKTGSNLSSVSARFNNTNNKPCNKDTSGTTNSGTMETLKTMLFTLQAEANVVNANDGDGAADGLLLDPQETKDMHENRETVLPSLTDYNFLNEPGGQSLQKALSHLNRLKSLVDNQPTKT